MRPAPVRNASWKRPLLMATTFMAGVGAIFSAWIDDGSPDDLEQRIDAFTELLRNGFEGAA